MRVPAAARRGHQRLAAVLEEVLRELLRDLLDSLIPADALEAVRAALPHALHGVLVATGVVQRLDARKALRAQASALMGLSGLPSSRMTRPSRTVAMTAQLQMHAWHEV